MDIQDDAQKELKNDWDMAKYQEREDHKYGEHYPRRTRVPFGMYTPSEENLRQMGQNEKYEKMHWDAMHE